MRHVILAGCMLVASLTNASAEWRIDIESKVVTSAQTAVNVDITAWWDLDLMGFTLPLVAREIDPGAFWTGALPVDTLGGVPRGITWSWPDPDWAQIIQELKPGAGCATPGNLYDGISPDNFVLNCASFTTPVAAEPAGHVVAVLTFDVTAVSGAFEFDTACYNGNIRSIYMIDNALPLVDHGPLGTGECSFTKGTISINASGDDDEDGILNGEDNCPAVFNPGQENNDGDAFGDVCDDDDDDDGVLDVADNCQFVANADQLDLDEDNIGDACDDCVCPAYCDLDGVTGFSPLDVTFIVKFVYKQLDARPALPNCPKENGDWNCDGLVTPLDVTFYVNFVYKSRGDGPEDPCVP